MNGRKINELSAPLGSKEILPVEPPEKMLTRREATEFQNLKENAYLSCNGRDFLLYQRYRGLELFGVESTIIVDGKMRYQIYLEAKDLQPFSKFKFSMLENNSMQARG